MLGCKIQPSLAKARAEIIDSGTVERVLRCEKENRLVIERYRVSGGGIPGRYSICRGQDLRQASGDSRYPEIVLNCPPEVSTSRGSVHERTLAITGKGRQDLV